MAAGSFSVISQQEDLAIPSRPVWILEQGYPKLAGQTASAGAEAAQTDTFSFGSLEPNQTREIVWRLTPVQSGTYTVHYRIAAGLQGKAVAVTDDGSVPEGEFVVVITDVPPQTRVDDSGQGGADREGRHHRPGRNRGAEVRARRRHLDQPLGAPNRRRIRSRG